jgi:hypothetical protein
MLQHIFQQGDPNMEHGEQLTHSFLRLYLLSELCSAMDEPFCRSTFLFPMQPPLAPPSLFLQV